MTPSPLWWSGLWQACSLDPVDLSNTAVVYRDLDRAVTQAAQLFANEA
jgi:hypothetical protein